MIVLDALIYCFSFSKVQKYITGCGRINRSHENVQILEKIVDNFPKRLKACVEAKGGHFE
jgi:hypothetical protein